LMAILEAATVRDQGRSQRDVFAPDRHVRVRFPSRMREVMELIASFPTHAALIGATDFSGIAPRDIYNTILSRAPETIDVARMRGDYDAARDFEAALRSEEFQIRVLRNFLDAFPALRREIFIHVPKCAGTDLIINVGAEKLALSAMLRERAWVGPEEFLRILSGLARQATFSQDIFVFGHIQLGEYIELAGIRRDDRIVSIIRDPVDLLLSQANYAINRVKLDPEGHDPDSAEILRHLGLQRVPEDARTPANFKSLTAKALIDRRIAQPNRITLYLGAGRTPDFRRALTNLVTYNVEITTTRNYGAWLKRRWGVVSDTRHNQSQTFLTRREVDRFFHDKLSDSISEDQKLFDVVTWCLLKKGGDSIFGEEIGELIGDIDLADLPDRARAGLELGDEAARTAPKPFIVQGENALAIYRAEMPPDIADPSRCVETLKIDFTVDGNSKQYLAEGWSGAEPRHRWTNGPAAKLVIERPRTQADYVLRVVAAPFVWEDKLRRQRIQVTLNGFDLDVAALSALGLIEWHVPWETLAAREAVEIEFRLPDSRRASEIKEIDDHRVLGFAFRELALLSMPIRASVAPVRVVANPAPDAPAPPTPEDKSVAPELPLNELMLHFESIGENCEFGLVQRRCGVEPLGLLRFGSAPLPNLVKALEARFEGMGRPDKLEVQISGNGTEYMILDRQFGFLYHAWVLVNERSIEQVHAREVKRVPFLVRKLIEDISGGDKLLVYHGMSPLARPDVDRLLRAISTYGRATLLWVELADETHESGSVERIGPNLLRAHVDRFAPGENAHDVSLDAWVAVCRNAYSAWRQP
jgi:hypothetical protein